MFLCAAQAGKSDPSSAMRPSSVRKIQKSTALERMGATVSSEHTCWNAWFEFGVRSACSENTLGDFKPENALLSCRDCIVPRSRGLCSSAIPACFGPSYYYSFHRELLPYKYGRGLEVGVRPGVSQNWTGAAQDTGRDLPASAATLAVRRPSERESHIATPPPSASKRRHPSSSLHSNGDLKSDSRVFLRPRKAAEWEKQTESSYAAEPQHRTLSRLRMLPSSAGTVVTVRIDVLKELEALQRLPRCPSVAITISVCLFVSLLVCFQYVLFRFPL